MHWQGLRIALNATCIGARPSGAQQRFIGLYTEFARQNPDVEFLVYDPSDCVISDAFSDLPNVTAYKTPMASSGRMQRAVRGALYWGRALRKTRPDTMESFHIPPPFTNVRTLVTIHDLRGLRARRGSLEQVLFANAFNLATRVADEFITVSYTMRDELLEYCPSARVSVVYNGIDPEAYRAPKELGFLRKRLNLPEQYMLAVGHLEARKNYESLIHAQRILKSEARIDCPLVIVGRDGGCVGQLRTLISRLQLNDHVDIRSNVSNDELLAYYHLSSLFVFPSKYEGFGIPVLEAMACNVPMALSSIPVFREIGPKSALYFPPDDAAAMADSIRDGLTNSSLRQQQQSESIGLLNKFSFHNLALELRKLHERRIG